MSTFSSLPPEVTREVLDYLPIRSLLAFGLTSKNSHALQSVSLSRLRLGIFHSRLNSLVSFTETTADRGCTVQIVLPKAESRNRKMVIRSQNAMIRTIVGNYHHTLQDLDIALWELHDAAAGSVARVKNLRHLSIRLDHPHTKMQDMGRSFWETSPGSTVWNGLFAKAGAAPVLGRLQSLNLERAGITDYQLLQILESNPAIAELRLSKCLNITKETFEYLARSHVGKRLETLHFTHNATRNIDDRILEHIGELKSLQVSRLPTHRIRIN